MHLFVTTNQLPPPETYSCLVRPVTIQRPKPAQQFGQSLVCTSLWTTQQLLPPRPWCSCQASHERQPRPAQQYEHILVCTSNLTSASTLHSSIRRTCKGLYVDRKLFLTTWVMNNCNAGPRAHESLCRAQIMGPTFQVSCPE